jgi:Tol biopolymer transport system component
VTDICIARHAQTGTSIQTVYTEIGTRCGGPRWSPDGQYLAFHATGPEQGNFDTYIFTVREDGSDLQQLTDSELGDASPVWSPDGERIVWCRGGELWSMAPDGSDAKVLRAEDDKRYYTPDFSPDGTQIACVVADADNLPIVCVLAADGSDITSLAPPSAHGATQPRWSPDGKRVAVCSYVGQYYYVYGYIKYYGIYMTDADGSNGKWVANSKSWPVPTASWTSPDWAADGRSIICLLHQDDTWLASIKLTDPTESAKLTSKEIGGRDSVSGVDVYVRPGVTPTRPQVVPAGSGPRLRIQN